MDIAILNDNGVLVDVLTVHKSEWKTDPSKKQVKLDPGHDMRSRIGAYKYDFHGGYFMPVQDDPVQDAFEAPDLISGIIELIDALDKGSAVDVPLSTRLAVASYKRSVDFNGKKGKRGK